MKWLQLSWRNVLRHKRRSFLAVSVMALGAGAMLAAAGFMLASFYGLRETTIRGGLGHIQIGAADGVVAPAEQREIEQALTGHKALRFTMGRISFEGLISNGPKTAAIIASGVEAERETRLSTGFALVLAGTGLPVGGDDTSSSALLGQGLAEKLGAEPGDDLTVLATTLQGVLNAIDVQVVGTFTTGVPELDARQVLMPVGAAKTLLGTAGVSRLVVVLKNTDDTTTVANQLRARFPALRVQTWEDLAPFYGQVVTLYRNIFTVLGAILLAVVSLSIANTMLMAVTERVREMGTMLALGISRRRIRLNFAVEGAIMGTLAGLAGLALGALVAAAVNLASIDMPPPPGRTTPYPLIIFVDPWACLILFVMMIATGALAAWVPTRRLRRLEIVEALRQT